VVQSVELPEFDVVYSLPGSARGEGGFGSTGVDGVAEKEFRQFPWEADSPFRAEIAATCVASPYATTQTPRLGSLRLRAENERMKALIDLIQNDIRNLSRENMQKMQAGIDYRPKTNGVRASA
jgi:hypothetical protein